MSLLLIKCVKRSYSMCCTGDGVLGVACRERQPSQMLCKKKGPTGWLRWEYYVDRYHK